MMKYKIKSRLIKAARRPFAITTILILLFEIGFPSVSLALTSGPSQPEVQSFEPVGTSQMVDPFSGDFTYNIPLLEIDGYPINISYHSGITMDQEASFVGLGWNINPGCIVRGMRGIPDDFNGENIVRQYNMKPNKTYGVTLGAEAELIGGDHILNASLSADLTVRFNNYTGVGIDQSISGTIPLGEGSKPPCNLSLGLTSSSDNGLTVQPNVSLSATMHKGDQHQTNLSVSLGTAFNSRSGLQHLTCGMNISYSASMKPDQSSGAHGTASKQFSSSYSMGMPTYVPQLTLPFSTASISASFKIGGQIEGFNLYGKIAGYYSCQTLGFNSASAPAYGYLHADEGVKYDNAIMDFNREKDGTFTLNTPALAVPNFTYDVLSVSGQGIGGSYRPFRNDFGQVFDPAVTNSSSSTSAGAEFGIPMLVKGGIDVAVSNVDSKSGRWSQNNNASPTNYFTQSSSDAKYEHYYYKEANEKSVDSDPSFFQRAGGFFAPSHYKLDQAAYYDTKLSSSFTNGAGASGTRSARAKRSQNITFLDRAELAAGYGLDNVGHQFYGARTYHTAEITSTTSDGRRYVYGIAAYNTRQEETTFAVGSDEFDSGGYQSYFQSSNGLVSYNSGDNSVSNGLGVDNYFSNTILPPFSHSYLLTGVLSADYVDSDTIKGPSVDDLGTYTKFNYTRTDSTYKWRTPFEYQKANFNEGLKWTHQDDKASYVYGEKEMWYLTSVESKNYIAVFSLEDRKDGFGVQGKDGGLDASHKSKLLRKISLYTRSNYEAHAANSSIELIPLKEVHFTYDYSRCPSVPNNNNASEFVNGIDQNQWHGKLTLRKISFSFQSSAKARLNPYKFDYSSTNPPYNLKGYDRWGNYKPQDPSVTGDKGCNPMRTGISNAEFPYVVQDTALENGYASAWSLTEVTLPSGGKMQVSYESDDYAYVQNKRAGQMFQIVGISTSKTTPNDAGGVQYNDQLSDNSYLVIKLQTPISGANPNGQFYDQYLAGLDYVYFRFLYNMSNPSSSTSTVPDSLTSTFEYVPGYIPASNIYEYGVYPGGVYGYIRFNSVHINDNSTSNTINPITKAALQYGRLNEAKNVWQAPGVTSGSSFGEQLLKSFVQSNFVQNIKDAIEGPNNALYYDHNCCKSFMQYKSWIRLNNPNKHKLGGGCRVKKILVSDEWNTMTASSMPTFSYGQEYFYTNEDGSSSGVATYEPQIGGDENSLHTPVFFDSEKLLAPNDENYQEEPYGECFFTSPSVGYGRVTVQNLKYSNVHKHASGKVVHEFWTARDFPTITRHSSIQSIREKTDPFSLSSFLNIDVKDYLTASQGFYVELNDMHGKPKAEKVYQEGISTPISSIEYSYKKVPYSSSSYVLNNSAQVINSNGSVSTQDIGTTFDFVTDMREQSSTTVAASANFNMDALFIVIGSIVIPTIWPSYSSDATQFRSAASTKVVQRFGLLEKVIAKDLGSTVETENLAYDAETGDVILTRTKTDYNDPLYTLKFPAYWYYDGMGPAYQNSGIEIDNASYSNTTGKATVNNPSQYFANGDQLEVNTGNTHLQAWVISIGSNYITLMDKAGNNLPSGTYNLRVLRSGRRNMQSETMASITTLQNPLSGVATNVYEKVLSVSGVEFNDQWSAFCECSNNSGPNPNLSYTNGARGNWRKKRAFAYLTNRTQSNYDNNTKTRTDGVFTSFTPLYKRLGAHWQMDTTNWTSTSKVTVINPNGQELENLDALGRYSAATYGYKQTLATAVAANSRFKELGVDNFEEYRVQNCSDKHFKFSSPSIDTLQSHTGRNSIRISAGSPGHMTRIIGGDSYECSTVGQNSCNMTYLAGVQLPDGNIPYSFSGNGAITPLTLSWSVLSGNPTVSLNGNGIKIRPSSAHWQVTVTVTGATGCINTFYISK